MPEVILIGTVHNDPKGPERLERMLSSLRPTVLTVEYSRIADEKIATLMGELAKTPRVISLFKRLFERFGGADQFMDFFSVAKETFEYGIAQEYAEKNTIPLHSIDNIELNGEEIGKEMVDILEKLTASQDTLNSTTKSALCDSVYLEAYDIINGLGSRQTEEEMLDLSRMKFGVGARDGHMEKRIREILAMSPPDSRLAHIGGLAHIYDDKRGETLYSRIKDLNPRRVLIYEVERQK